MDKNKLEVVLTPTLLPLYITKGKAIVIIDILRATTSMCVAFHIGVQRILPVSTPEEAKLFKDFDFLIAAERNAEKVAGADMGNSPFEFQNPLLNERSIAFTTTNGTKAIKAAKQEGAAIIAIGSFLNLNAICQWLVKQQKDVLLVCAGWKDKYNLEDTLFAGAVTQQVQHHFDIDCDAALSAMMLYEQSKNDLENTVRKASHAKRFQLIHAHEDDVHFCLQHNTLSIVPLMQGEYIVCPQRQVYK
jgi:2-phosphosulfolactate phosphatase